MRKIFCRYGRQWLACASALVFLLLAAPAAFASPSPWQDRAEQMSVDTRVLDAPLHAYRALSLDLPALRTSLNNAADERRGTSPLMLDLPMPDGSMMTFAVWRTQVMAPALAAKYPQIRSFTGYAVGHPESRARLDDSPLGFSVMIRAPHGVTVVQPTALGEGSRYISFRREALGKPSQPFVCGVHDQSDPSATLFDHGQRSPVVQTSTGAALRTYRLALAATGEYTAAFGGTKADAMADMVQAINRVNGIFVTDLGVQFQIIADDDALIYTNASSDPYSNDDGELMLYQNQRNIDTVIGSANYDFGHVFSTGGGGIAGLGVACNRRDKAHGVTGLPNPTGDAFWVDFVAHEMGHQMGSDHTYNSTDGNCDGNRAASLAVEPGSGSTIMAYAGICGPSDLQPHSDPYFHAASLAVIAQRLAGGGGHCGATVTPDNAPPIVDAGPDFTIPVHTPFELTGRATDADDDTLTFTWEEMDTGAAAPPNDDDGTRALFRSYNPTTSPRRLVPELARILTHDVHADIPDGGDLSGETWATTTRDLKFRLTVRDNWLEGATASGDMTVHVSADAGPFLVTAPLGAATWMAGFNEAVTWDVANTAAPPVSCTSVDVMLSTDGGTTFPTLLAASVANTGTTTVVAPAAQTTTARIEVRCHGNIFFDISPGNFSIGTDTIFKDDFD